VVFGNWHNTVNSFCSVKSRSKVGASAPEADPSPIGTVGRNGIYLIPHEEFSQAVTEDFESYSTSKTSDVMRRVKEGKVCCMQLHKRQVNFCEYRRALKFSLS